MGINRRCDDIRAYMQQAARDQAALADALATVEEFNARLAITCGGASISGAAEKLAENLRALAADALEAAVRDLEIAGGAVRIAGTDRAVSFADLAGRPGASEKLTLATASVTTHVTSLFGWI